MSKRRNFSSFCFGKICYTIIDKIGVNKHGKKARYAK